MSGAWDMAKGAVSGAADYLGGSGSDPGLLGTGQERFNPYGVNKNAFYNQDQANKRRGELYGRQQQVDARGAPIAQAASYGGANAGPAAQSAAAQLGPASQVGPVTLGPAGQAAGTQLDQTQSNQVRDSQMGLIKSLQDQAAGKGPSQAGIQLQNASDRDIANEAALAASGGGNAALNKRNLSVGAVNQEQATANSTAQTKIQEQQNAVNNLGNVTSATRGQDLGAATTNAQLGQENNQFDTTAGNNFKLAQGNIDLDIGKTNAGSNNTFAEQNAAFQQQTAMGNTAAENERQALQAQLYQQAGIQSAGWQQQTAQGNQQAQLNQEQLNDQMTQYLTGAGLGIDQRAQESQQGYEALEAQQGLGYAGLDQKAYEAARGAKSGAFGGMLGGATSLLAMSDEAAKTSVSNGDDKIKAFLDHYMQSVQGQATANTSGANSFGAPQQGSFMGGFNGGMSAGKNLAAAFKGQTAAPAAPGIAPMTTAGGGGMSPAVSPVPEMAPDVIAESDEDVKTHISNEDADKKIGALLSNIKPHEYEYKNPEKPGRGEGKFISPMAQEFEKSDLGDQMVKEGPDGKMVDYGAGHQKGFEWATMAYLHKRLEKLESKEGMNGE